MTKLNANDQAIQMLKQIEDATYRAAAIDAVVELRVLRDLGYKHPYGDLAMQLRREAKATA